MYRYFAIKSFEEPQQRAYFLALADGNPGYYPTLLCDCITVYVLFCIFRMVENLHDLNIFVNFEFMVIVISVVNINCDG